MQWRVNTGFLRSSEVSTLEQLQHWSQLITLAIGGSFGVVYKAVEIATGELVAIKHVSPVVPTATRVGSDSFKDRSRI